MKRVVLYIAIFLMLGELVLRFDAATLYYQGSRFVELKNEPVQSELLTALQEDRFETEERQLRIMLLGDSILYRRALPPGKAFASVLEHRLQQYSNQGGGDEVLILDLLAPGVGPTQLRDRYFEFADDFEPHVVFWAYNRADVHQVVERNAPETGSTRDAGGVDLGWRDRLKVSIMFFKKRVTRDFKVFSYFNRNLTRELKARGIVLPGSRFEFMIERSHHPDFRPWQLTQDYFAEVQQRCQEQDTILLVMITPLLDILPYYDLVSEMDRDLESTFVGLGINCFNGAEPFLNNPDGDYAVSRYDEHPNAEAHGIIAEAVAERLIMQVENR